MFFSQSTGEYWKLNRILPIFRLLPAAYYVDVNDLWWCIQLAGVVNTYFYTLITYWWFFHTIIIFWKIWFPFQARNFSVNGYSKYLHITIVVVSACLSLIPVATDLGTGGFVISTNPPFLNFCYPRSPDAFFYTAIFTYSIVISIGVTLNLLTFWKLVRMNKFISKQVYYTIVSSAT